MFYFLVSMGWGWLIDPLVQVEPGFFVWAFFGVEVDDVCFSSDFLGVGAGCFDVCDPVGYFFESGFFQEPFGLGSGDSD